MKDKNLFRLICIPLIVLPSILDSYAQTPEEELQQCVLKEIESYQPISEYVSEFFACKVGNKKSATGAPPHKDPYPISLKYEGFVFLDAQITVWLKVGDGGHTPPYITPHRNEVTSSMWCKAEDRLFGDSGHYKIRISGKKQRVATRIEYRKSLQKCSQQVKGLWVSNY